jgi:transposase
LNREREIVRWVSRLGAVSVEQIGRRFGVGRSVAYEQVRRLVKFGLLERTQTAIGDPTLISATREGITYAGLGLKRPTIRLGEVDHWLALMWRSSSRTATERPRC